MCLLVEPDSFNLNMNKSSKVKSSVRRKIKPVIRGIRQSFNRATAKFPKKPAQQRNKIPRTKKPRVLKLPKFGGSLNTILPILNGLSAIGSITASTVRAVKAIKGIPCIKKVKEKFSRAIKFIYRTGRKAKGAGFYLKAHQRR